MIYQDTLRFLRRKIKKTTSDYQWRELDNIDFFNMLFARYELDEIKTNTQEIKEAFRDFFEPVGKLLFKFDITDGVQFKIIPYSVKPSQSKHLNRLVEIIKENRTAIIHPYNGREDQIALSGKIRRRINSEIADSEESVNKKELIKYAIKQALKLSDKDIILLSKRKYIVKLFQKVEKKEPVQSIEQKPEKYHGYDIEELAEDYEQFFEDIDAKSFIDGIVDKVLEDKLSFDKIDNFFYEQNANKIFKEAIEKELKKYLEEDAQTFIEAFADYIFRMNFIAIHERVAIALLESIVKKNQSAEKFLKYYSGETLLRHGKKYQIPYLQTEDGGKWHVASVISIASLFIKTRNKRDKYSIELNKILQELENATDVLQKSEQRFETLKSMKEKLQKSLEATLEALENIEMTFKAYSKERMDEVEQHRLLREEKEYNKSADEIKDRLAEIENQRKKAQESYFIQKEKVATLTNKRNELKSEIHNLEHSLMVNNGSYQSILTSLTKAIMQKKVIVD